jgi:S1-C subfamily serine protease
VNPYICKRFSFVTTLAIALFGGAVNVSNAQQPSDLSAAVALETAMVNTIENCEKSVVAIARTRKGLGDRLLDPEFIPTEFATGVVVGREGLVLTVYHALGDPDGNDYVVWVEGRGHRATIKAADPTYDLAVLEIKVDSLTPMPLGEAGDLKKGQIVIALGNPLAIARDGNASATWGIVSNLHRKAAPRPDADAGVDQKDTLHHYGTLIQTDARLERGTSGGALINLKGQMIGLTSAAAALPGSEKSAGFAIPVGDTFRHVVQQLKLGRSVAYGFLGVAPDDSYLAEREGVRIVNVVRGTPAATADLRVGDVITQVGSEPLHSAGDLILQVSSYPAGQTVPIRFVRLGGRAPLVRDVTLSKKFIRGDRPMIATRPVQPWRGMTVDYTTAHPRFVELSFDADADGCVVVTDVAADSPAWKAGLRSGLFISHVGNRRVKTPDEFHRAVANGTGDVQLYLASQFDRLEPTVVPAQ